jgi:CRISPR system Cascade subunit CasE
VFISRVVLKDLQILLASTPYLHSANNSYSYHQFLWTLFPDFKENKEFSFLFRHEPNYHRFSFIVVSAYEPKFHPAWDIQTKPYAPKIKNGTILEFVLTANPVVSRKLSDNKRSKRCDVVMDWKYRNDRKSKALSDIVSDEGLKWLGDKGAKHGFRVLTALADGYAQRHFYKPNSQSRTKLSTIEFSGVIEVTEASLFEQILYSGLGPAKGFGCGLVMVKRQ